MDEAVVEEAAVDEAVVEEAAVGVVGRGLDAALGLARSSVVPAQALAARGVQPLRALTQLALRPPLVPDALSPARALHDVSDRARHGAEATWVAAHDLVESVLDAQLPRIFEAVLDRIDLNALIAERVDVALIVESVLDQLDLTELSRTRIDLAQLATEVIDEIDLPAIIRESTSGVASDVVTGARAGAASADEAVARFLSRRRRRRVDVGEQP